MQTGAIHVTGKPTAEQGGKYILQNFRVLNSSVSINEIKIGDLVQTDDFAYIVDGVQKVKGKIRLLLHPF
jgi:hypothetical protein